MRSLNRSLKSTASMVQPTPLTFTAASVQSDVMKQDYEEKCLALMSVQRNYETISRMMQQKQTEYAEVCAHRHARTTHTEARGFTHTQRHAVIHTQRHGDASNQYSGVLVGTDREAHSAVRAYQTALIQCPCKCMHVSMCVCVSPSCVCVCVCVCMCACVCVCVCSSSASTKMSQLGVSV